MNTGTENAASFVHEVEGTQTATRFGRLLQLFVNSHTSDGHTEAKTFDLECEGLGLA